MARHAFLDHPGPIAFAHRGGAGPWPENSWPAFAHAVALGYRYLETDIRVTRDGTAMILHDPILDRVSDHTGPLAELTTAEAARIRPHPPAARPATTPPAPSAPATAGQDQPNFSGGEPIPRLDELLDRWPDARLNLDVKEAAALEPTIAALRRANALGRVCVTSFDDDVAREARRLAGPGLCLGAGMSAIAAARMWSVLPSRLATRRPRGLVERDVVQVPVSYRSIRVCDARFVRYMKAVGLPVHVWTINDEAAMDALLDLGVDGLITDRPESLRTVLRRRDLWPAA
jgi:glycerophosphoryl diester phosphodiesterase